MKFNKWTLGLAAVGAVSLTSVAQAEEKMMLGSQANLTSTTISGYVSTSAHWDFGAKTDLAATRGYAYSAGKGDGFNLDVVDLNIEKALDESEWAAGYRAELWFGPDAVALATQATGGDMAIKQAFVALRTPIGNGIDWKMGVFDTIIGYESANAGDNPNYTRSWGNTIEPTQHTGLLGTYRFCDTVSASFGVANTHTAAINSRVANDTSKTYMASVALTAPESFGFLQGASLYAGFANGKVAVPGSAARTSYYVGATIPTPVEGLKAGVAFDYMDMDDRPGLDGADTLAIAAYLSARATEKLTINTRIDYLKLGGDGIGPSAAPGAGSDLLTGVGGAFATGDEFLAVTVTGDYQLWKNVISRAEFRWDHDLGENGGNHFRAGSPTLLGHDDEYSLMANIIYKF